MGQLISPPLIDKICTQDQHAFGEFYLQTVDIFYRFARSNYQMAEDDIQQLLSEFYIKIREHLPNYDPAYKFDTRCWTIYRNLLKDRFKKHKEYHFGNFQSDDDQQEGTYRREDTLVSPDEDIVSILDRQFTHDRIIDSLGQLDLNYAEVIHLRYVESKTYEQIAELCNVSVENVRQRISRGLKKLKILLESD